VKGVLIFCLLFTVALSASGCAVARALNDEPGTDVSSVTPGISRITVQARLGDPLREWSTSEGIRYCIYIYDGGYQGNASEASAMLFLDIIGAGLPELIVLLAPDTLKPRHETKQMAVAYDQHGYVVGVFPDFSDFEELPENGNPDERKPIPINNSVITQPSRICGIRPSVTFSLVRTAKLERSESDFGSRCAREVRH
jgi:hypothetical protein